ncbi:Glutamine synthetase [Mycena chlorophos]|uniref:Glutamine synthetase n=1 Tax=Mycena chlorophos TaxID=658473 RepID=A0A8H6S5W1_MYCCL|nr:Glutamine synthetase [Mycena chlorophos]
MDDQHISAEIKLSLPKFLKIFTGNNMPMAKAMLVAGKCYKDYSTPSKLSELDDFKLAALGIEEKDLRKQVVASLRKAGYVVNARKTARASDSNAENPEAGPSQPRAAPMTAVEVLTTPTKRKRSKAAAAVNEFLPEGPKDESQDLGNLEFNEVLDEEVLKTKSTVVNRAPLLTAWATLVAERVGFQREEALSIASVFTELNAISKGIAIGKYKKSAAAGMEASPKGTQPYVDLMGRRPLYQNQNSQWRGLSGGKAVQPSTAFSYISRALRQTTPHVIGAMKLLLETYTIQEINAKGWGLYADFRPDVNGWGDRAEVRCSTILGLRKARAKVVEQAPAAPRIETDSGEDPLSDEPPLKKARGMTVEEYEAALDEDGTFDHVDLDELTGTVAS